MDPVGSTTSLAQSDVSQSGSAAPHHGSISSSAGGGHGGRRRQNLSDMLDSRIDRILKDWHQVGISFVFSSP